ncbi:Hypothetical protein NTJ_10073 [Nesidiocoris tenuis]|uniref:Uncharacterized protein n=1 Tax=Nesidiocoris tenuis TaxID=355587 RepID=A0ABN7B104_9HEMI|nr:Hypothetical protein NTJ_10073 [Nesidiocoris tenuis]
MPASFCGFGADRFHEDLILTLLVSLPIPYGLRTQETSSLFFSNSDGSPVHLIFLQSPFIHIRRITNRIRRIRKYGQLGKEPSAGQYTGDIGILMRFSVRKFIASSSNKTEELTSSALAGKC